MIFFLIKIFHSGYRNQTGQNAFKVDYNVIYRIGEFPDLYDSGAILSTWFLGNEFLMIFPNFSGMNFRWFFAIFRVFIFGSHD